MNCVLKYFSIQAVVLLLTLSGLCQTSHLGHDSHAPLVATGSTSAEDDDYDDYDPDDVPDDQAAPVTGYNYPIPENPLILPISAPEELYDDYDPSDVPDDQAKPAPDCVNEDDQDTEENIQHLQRGVPLCPSDDLPGYQVPATDLDSEDDYDDYDPNDIPDDQAAPLPTYKATTPAPPDYDDYDPNDIPADQAAPSGYSYPVPNNPLQLRRKNKKHDDDDDHRTLIKHQNGIRPKPNKGRGKTKAKDNPKKNSNEGTNENGNKNEIITNKQVRKPKLLNVSTGKIKSQTSTLKKTGPTSSVTNRNGRQIISVSDWLARG